MAGNFLVGSITAKLRLEDNEFVKTAKAVVQKARALGRDVKTALGRRNTVEFIEQKPVLNALNRIARAVRRFAKRNKLSLRSAFTLPVRAIVRGYRAVQAAGVQAARAIRVAGRGIATPFRLLRRSIFSLQGAFLALGVSIGGAALVERARNVEALTGAFNNLSRSVGAVSKSFLGDLRKATKGAVSDLELIKATNNAVLLGVVQSQEEFAEFASIARQLGKAVGRDTVDAINDLSLGVGRQSRLILDNLGLIVKVEDATEKYANSLGVAVSALTDAERRTAFYNAAIDAGRRKVAELGPDTDTLADSIGRFRAEISNTATAIASAFVTGGPFEAIARWLKRNRRDIIAFSKFVADSVKILITFVARIIEDIFGSGSSERFTSRIAKAIKDTLQFTSKLIQTGVGIVFSRLGATILALIGQLLLTIVIQIPKSVVQLIATLEAELIKGLITLTSKIPGLSGLLGLDDPEKLQEALDAVDRDFGKIDDFVEGAAQVLQDKVDGMIGETSDILERELVAAIANAKRELKEFGEEGEKSGNKILASTAKGIQEMERALQKLKITRADPIAGSGGLTLQRELKDFQDRFNALQALRKQTIQDFPDAVGEKQVLDSAKVLQDLEVQLEATQKKFLAFVEAPKEAKAALQDEFIQAAVATGEALDRAGAGFLSFGSRIAGQSEEIEGSTERVKALFEALERGAGVVTGNIDISSAIERATRPVFLAAQEFDKILAPFQVKERALKLEVALEGVDEALQDAKRLEFAIAPFRERLSPDQTNAVDELIAKLRKLGLEKEAKTRLVEFTKELESLELQLVDVQRQAEATGLTALDRDFAQLAANLQNLKTQFPEQDFKRVEEIFSQMGIALAEAQIKERAVEAEALKESMEQLGLTDAEVKILQVASSVDDFRDALIRAGVEQAEITRLVKEFRIEASRASEATVFLAFEQAIRGVKDRVADLRTRIDETSPIRRAQAEFRESTRQMSEEVIRSAEALLAQAQAAGASEEKILALTKRIETLKRDLAESVEAGATAAGVQASEADLERQAKEIGSLVNRNLGRGIITAFRDGESVSKQWASIAAGFFEDAMAKTIKRLTDLLGTAFSKILESAGLGAGAAGIVTGVLGIAGAIFNSIEKKSQTTVDDFDEAINSSEAVRGVVAGPSNIAISKVGDSLKEALRTSEILLERIAVGVEGGGGSIGSGGAVDGAALRGNGALPLSTSTAT